MAASNHGHINLIPKKKADIFASIVELDEGVDSKLLFLSPRITGKQKGKYQIQNLNSSFPNNLSAIGQTLK